MSSNPPRVVKVGPTTFDGGAAVLVRLLRDPKFYPPPFRWNELYREAVRSQRARLSMSEELAAVDAEILEEGFRREDYASWLDQQVGLATEPGAWWAVNSLVSKPAMRVFYQGGPAGLNQPDHTDTFRDPYVEVVVSSDAMALQLLLAFKGT